jgi:hypothetical protein
MTRRTLVPLLFVLAALPWPAALAGGEEGETLTAVLEPTELPVTSFKSLLGLTVTSDPRETPPEGYDSIFDPTMRSGRKRIPYPGRFLHKGWTPEDVKICYRPEKGEVVELPRLKRGIYNYYLAFGPVHMKGMPPVTVHFYFPPARMNAQNVDRWKKGRKMLYLVPARALTGEVCVGDMTFTLGLLDVNLNGSHADPCVEHARDGDWLLVDTNGDETFDIGYSNGESRGLTKCVRLGGKTWRLRCEGKTLSLTPVTLECYRLKIDGIGSDAVFYGWSVATGTVSGQVGADGCVDIPKDDFRPYSYQWVKDGWKVSASLRNLGVLSPPESGEAKVLTVGPKLRIQLTKRDQGEQTRFSFRCLGRGGESVTLYKGRTRVDAPVLVVTNGVGKEVLRQAMRYG